MGVCPQHNLLWETCGPPPSLSVESRPVVRTCHLRVRAVLLTHNATTATILRSLTAKEVTKDLRAQAATAPAPNPRQGHH